MEFKLGSYLANLSCVDTKRIHAFRKSEVILLKSTLKH